MFLETFSCEPAVFTPELGDVMQSGTGDGHHAGEDQRTTVFHLASFKIRAVRTTVVSSYSTVSVPFMSSLCGEQKNT